MTGGTVGRFFEVYRFTERCHDVQVAMAPCKIMCMDMLKKAKRPKITFFFAVSPISSTAVQSVSFDHADNFQPGKPPASH
jgi:hypothetical protein